MNEWALAWFNIKEPAAAQTEMIYPTLSTPPPTTTLNYVSYYEHQQPSPTFQSSEP